jgi:predicted ArsR family transcriptional regulator
LRLKEDLHKLRKILVKKGPRTWGELKEETTWSPSVLKNRIDLLINRGEVSLTVGKRKGRRTTLYKASEEKNSKAEISRYEAVKFIESIKDPTHSTKTRKDNKVRATVFTSSLEDPKYQEKMQKLADTNAKIFLRYAEKLIPDKLFLFPTKPGLKIAVVLTKES